MTLVFDLLLLSSNNVKKWGFQIIFHLVKKNVKSWPGEIVNEDFSKRSATVCVIIEASCKLFGVLKYTVIWDNRYLN